MMKANFSADYDTSAAKCLRENIKFLLDVYTWQVVTRATWHEKLKRLGHQQEETHTRGVYDYKDLPKPHHCRSEC